MQTFFLQLFRAMQKERPAGELPIFQGEYK